MSAAPSASRRPALAVPMPERLAPARSLVSVLAYHGLEDDPARLAARPLDVTPDSCLAEIRRFQALGYQLASAADLERLAEDPGPPRAYLVVSFDDGHLCTFPTLERFLCREGIPVLLAVCPRVVEEGAVYWWEEARARLAAMAGGRVELAAAGRREALGRDDAARFERWYLGLPRRGALALMAALRRATPEVSDQDVRRSPHVHRNMGWDEVRSLARHPLCTLASHALAHETATSLSAAALRRNALASRRWIEAATGRPVSCFVYPNGRHTPASDSVLAACGYRFAFSVEGGTNAVADLRRCGAVPRLRRFHGGGYREADGAAWNRLWVQRHAERCHAER